MKQIMPDPWTTSRDRYPIGTRIHGKVVSLTDYGAFVELEKGVEGLIHVSEMSWTKRVTHPLEGARAWARRSRSRCSTSIRRTGASRSGSSRPSRIPGSMVRVNHPDRQPHQGQGEEHHRLRRLRRSRGGHRRPGAHLRPALDEEGQAPVRALSRRATTSRRSCSASTSRTSASRSASSSSRRIPGARCGERHPVGSRVHGTVTSVTDFGVFVEIEEGIEGLIHVSQLSTERVDKPQSSVQARRRGRGRGDQHRSAREAHRALDQGAASLARSAPRSTPICAASARAARFSFAGHPERRAASRPRRGRRRARNPDRFRSDGTPSSDPRGRSCCSRSLALLRHRRRSRRTLSRERGRSRSLSKQAVAVVTVQGVIEDASDIVEALDRLAENDGVRAVVLRVDSPGGAVAPSQEIYDAVERVRERKPVVASLGNVAASGGYYVASACDSIVANPGTLTGSIGVIMETGNVTGLLEKLGVAGSVVKSGKVQGHRIPLRAMTDEERALPRRAWSTTCTRSSSPRSPRAASIPEDQVRPLADGRIYSGQQALDLRPRRRARRAPRRGRARRDASRDPRGAAIDRDRDAPAALVVASHLGAHRRLRPWPSRASSSSTRAPRPPVDGGGWSESE